jgi:hypothetical protein
MLWSLDAKGSGVLLWTRLVLERTMSCEGLKVKSHTRKVVFSEIQSVVPLATFNNVVWECAQKAHKRTKATRGGLFIERLFVSCKDIIYRCILSAF